MKRSILFLSIFFATVASAQQGWVPLTSGTTETLNYISLIGSDTIYVSGYTALRSTDAGVTWDSLTNMPSYLGVRMTAAKVQFVDNMTGYLSGSADTVYKTTDGGQSWHANNATYLPGGLAPDYLFFKTRDSGWVGYSGRLSSSSDGGNTWAYHATYDWNFVAFYDTKHGFMMGNVAAWQPDRRFPDAASFERTNDGGAIWTEAYTHLSKAVYGVAAATLDTLIGVGLQIARSTDGGDTWDTIAYEGDGNNGFMAVTFPDHLHGTAVGTSGWIFHTTDAGLTWQRQNSGITDQSFLYSVRFIDSLTGYSVGDNGIILKTTNAGYSWVNISPTTSDLVQAISYPEPCNTSTKLSFSLPEPQHVWLSFFDMNGRKVGEYLNGVWMNSGRQVVSIDTRAYSSGQYKYDLITDKYYGTGTITVVH